MLREIVGKILEKGKFGREIRRKFWEKKKIGERQLKNEIAL